MSDARYLPYLLLLPATLFLSAFFLVPFLGVAVEAFTSSDGALSFDNFRTMAQDWRFWPAFSNTLGLALVIVPIQVVLALAMANLVTSMGSGREIVLYILTVPLGISDLAAGLVWLAILEQNGFLTSFLHGLGLIAGPQPTSHLPEPYGAFHRRRRRRSVARHRDRPRHPGRRNGAHSARVL